MEDKILSKSELLSEMIGPQLAMGRLLFESDRLKNEGKLAEAGDALRRLAEAGVSLLELELLNNEHFPDSPFDVVPTVGTLANSLLTRADVVDALGEDGLAEGLRRLALEYSSRYLPESEIAERKRQQAGVLVSQGRFHEALSSLFDARDLFEREDDSLGIAGVTMSIAGILEWLGDYERASEEVRRALALIEPMTGGHEVSFADLESKLAPDGLPEAEKTIKLLMIQLDLEQTEARSARHLGKYAEAERLFRRIMPRLPRGSEVGIGFQLAAIEIGRGKYREGLASLSRLEPYFVGFAQQKLGVLRSEQAEALLGLGSSREALRCAEEAQTLLSGHRDLDSLWKAQSRRARCLEALGEPRAALAAYEDCVSTIDSLRRAPLGYRLDSLYLNDKIGSFSTGIRLACGLEDGMAACRLMELAKSRALTAALSVPRVPRGSPAGDTIEKKIDKLSLRMDAIEYRAYAEGEDSETEFESIRKEREALIERARIADPRWRNLTQPPPFDAELILAGLRARRQTALSLYVDGESVFSVLLGNGECSCGRMELRSDTICAIEEYRGNLLSGDPSYELFDPNAFSSLSADRIIPERMLRLALEADSLVVVPHGVFHLLPWPALALDGKRLFEMTPIGILPNLSSLIPLSREAKAETQLAFIGAPSGEGMKDLAGTRLMGEEGRIIAEVYRDRVLLPLLTGHEAAQGSFRDLLARMGSEEIVLHVACHGYFPPEGGDPMGAGLFFADGKLDAAEISRLRIPCAEVVLSACSSGYRPTRAGKVRLTGDDILGLPGAFLEAGARSVLVSIPPAGDAAAFSFMTYYHEHRANGASPLASLLSTQRWMLQEKRWPPCLWVGFILYGCQ